MPWWIELLLFVWLLISAVVALQARNLLAAVTATSAFSFTAAVLFAFLGAVDVGFTEAVVGAGVVGVFYVAAIFQTTQRSND